LDAHGSRPDDQETVSYYLLVEIPNSVRFIRAESGKIAFVLDTVCNYPGLSSAMMQLLTNSLIGEYLP
jgi:hypothetical protein